MKLSPYLHFRKTTVQWSLSGFFLFALISCNSIPDLGDKHYNQDFYFVGGFVQVQGRSRLPDVKAEALNPDSSREVRFLSLQDRRKLCLDQALENSKARFLSLTVERPAEIPEWTHRLRKGDLSDGQKSCLQGAVVRQHFYDSLDECRVVVYIPCYPHPTGGN